MDDVIPLFQQPGNYGNETTCTCIRKVPLGVARDRLGKNVLGGVRGVSKRTRGILKRARGAIIIHYLIILLGRLGLHLVGQSLDTTLKEVD